MPFTKNKINMIFALAILLLTGCDHPDRVPSDPVLSKTEKWFIVTEIDRPDYFYVSFREEGTNYQFKRQYVSKYCSDWRKLKIGSRWKLVEVVRQGNNSTYSELEGVRSEFCLKVRAL